MNLVQKLLSIPKTILFNFKVFPFRVALKLPVVIGYNVKTPNIYKNCIQINSEISRFMIKLNVSNGSDGVNNSHKQTGYFDVKKKGKVIFNGRATLSSGVSIRVDSGNLTFGNNFQCNRNCFFSCSTGITFGNDVLLGWSVNVRDSDGHAIKNLKDNTEKPRFKQVSIGNHVWIAAKVDILKGVEIPDDCIIGYNSCITTKFEDKNCIIAGYPAKVVQSNVSWVE